MPPVKNVCLVVTALLCCANTAQADAFLFFWLPQNGNSDYMQQRYEDYERGNASREVERLRESLGIIDPDGQRYLQPDPDTRHSIDEQWRREGYELLFDEQRHLPGNSVGPDYRSDE